MKQFNLEIGKKSKRPHTSENYRGKIQKSSSSTLMSKGTIDMNSLANLAAKQEFGITGTKIFN